jgi:hypothetical protein
LSGSVPNPTVAKLQTRPVSSTSPLDGQALMWNGSAWAPGNLPSGGGGGGGSFVTNAKAFASSMALNFNGTDRYTLTLTGNATISAITNVPERGAQLVVTQGGGGPYTLAWPWNVKRPVGETLDPLTGVTVYSLALVSGVLYAAKSSAFEDNDEEPEGGGGGGTYAPTDRAALIGWFKAATANVTLSTADVQIWNDLSAQNNAAGIASYGGLPLWHATDAAYASHGSVEFDRDVPEGMNANGVALDITGPFTISAVCKFSNLTTDQAVWGVQGAGGYIQLGMDSGGLLTIVSEDAVFTFESAWHAGHDTAAHVVTAVITPKVGATPGSAVLYVDGTAVGLSTTNVTASGPFSTFTIGWSGGSALEGTIAEMTIFNEALDATAVLADATFLRTGKGI